MSDDGPMRQPGMGGSAVLERLAGSAVSAGVPDQSQLLRASDRESRLVSALAIPGTGCAGVLILLIVGMVDFFAVAMLFGGATGQLVDEADHTLVVVLPILGVIGTAFAIVYFGRAGRERALAIERTLRIFDQNPFPVTGYASWLVTDRPLLDVHLRTNFDAKLFELAVKGIDHAIEVEILDGNTARLAIPPLVASRGKAGSIRYGNVPLLNRVFAELLLPLHNDVGVERVEMGGLVHERHAE